jgi:hypothetical protein
MDQNEVQFDPRLLVVPPGASKIISEPMLHSGQTVQLSCAQINTISKWTEMSFHLDSRHLCVPLGAPEMVSVLYGTFSANRAPILRLD